MVGSGVAGAVCAYKLAQAGFEVTILEAGPPIDRQLAWRNYRTSEDAGQVYPAQPGSQPIWASERAYFEQAGPDYFGGFYERVVGGSTWHWNGTCLRFLASDFCLHSRYGQGVDWPLSLEELQPFYREAELELGVSGGAAMSALPPTLLDKLVGQAARKIGLQVQVLPAARNSRSYQGRPACQGNASCFPICPIGAKYDATVHLRRAQDLGVKLRSSSQVCRLIVQSKRVVGVQVQEPDGSYLLEADHFVLAANAIETPRLLMFSGLDRYPTGRFLMGMAGQVSWGLTPEPVWPHRSPQIVSGIVKLRDGSHRSQRAAGLTSIGNDGWPGHSPNELAQKLIEKGFQGRALAEEIERHSSRQMLLVTNCEELPRAENRVELGGTLDSAGVPRPRIHFRVGQYTQLSIEQAVLLHARIFDQLGASAVHHVEEAADPAHMAGTTRMGRDPKSSCVDPHLRWHDLENLFVIGSSVFPTCGTAPPTLTVAALAIRLASSLAQT